MQAAAELYKLRQDISDDNLWLISALEILNGVDTKEVLRDYKKIITGEIKVVEITSSIKLEKEQKQTLEEKLKSLLSEDQLVFHYDVNELVEKGLEIRIGDNVIEL